MGPAGSIFVVAALLTAQPPGVTIHQDFRNPLHESLKRVGTDSASIPQIDDLGLRITLPSTRKSAEPIGIGLRHGLKGDFEIVGVYQFLAGSKPKEGWGSGVVLNVSPDGARTQLAKVGRYLRVQEGNCIYAEYWTREPPKDWKGLPFRTDAQEGKLKLVREGETMRYLSAEGDGDFQEHLRTKFTPDELSVFRFTVVASSPGDVVDAKLISLTIQMGPATAIAPTAPKNVDQPTGAPQAVAPVANDEAEGPGSGDSLLWIALAGGLVVVAALGAWAMTRRRTAGDRTPPAEAKASVVSFPCPDCGKTVKVKQELGGRKIKCPKCGAVVRVPEGSPP